MIFIRNSKHKKFLIIAGTVALLFGVIFGLNYADKQSNNNNELTREQIETMVSIYIRENISLISPEPEVLGGTFYVTNINFGDANTGVVEYEDGHIALVADFEYFISEGAVAGIDLTNVREF